MHTHMGVIITITWFYFYSTFPYKTCSTALNKSRVPDQNGVSQAWYRKLVEIHHSGRKPLKYKYNVSSKTNSNLSELFWSMWLLVSPGCAIWWPRCAWYDDFSNVDIIRNPTKETTANTAQKARKWLKSSLCHKRYEMKTEKEPSTEKSEHRQLSLVRSSLDTARSASRAEWCRSIMVRKPSYAHIHTKNWSQG